MSIPFINRSELIKKLADKLDIDSGLAEQIVKIILQTMSESLEQGNRIEIRGFGSFELRYRAPRMARNPKTGARAMTQGHYAVHFKPGKELKERVNQSLSGNGDDRYGSSHGGNGSNDQKDDNY